MLDDNNPLEMIINSLSRKTKKQKIKDKIKSLKDARERFQKIVTEYDYKIDELEWRLSRHDE